MNFELHSWHLEYIGEVNNTHDNHFNEKKAFRDLYKCIQIQYKIDRFMFHFNQYFQTVILIGYFQNAIALAACLYSLPIQINNSDYNAILYLLPRILDLFFANLGYCSAGEFGSSWYENLLISSYKSQWYRMSPFTNKLLHILQCRLAQKRYISAYGIIILSRQNHVKFLQISFSYFTLMNSFH